MLQQTPETSPARCGWDAPDAKETGDSGSGANSQARKVRVEGDEAAVRSATLDIGGLIANIRAVEDPDPDELERYRAGVHLLHALQSECQDFGLASPGVEPEADIAEQIMGITDEAFEAADEFLMLNQAMQEGVRLPHPVPEVQSSQMCALLLEMKRLSIKQEMRVIKSLAPAATASPSRSHA